MEGNLRIGSNEGGKLGTTRTGRASPKEPRLNDVSKGGRRAFSFDELNGMIPSHASKRGSTPNENNFSLRHVWSGLDFACWRQRKVILGFYHHFTKKRK